MKILTVENIVNALQATLVNGEEFKEKALEGAAIDSRKVEKDNLFFAGSDPEIFFLFLLTNSFGSDKLYHKMLAL